MAHAIPFVAGIIEREKDGEQQILMQTRQHTGYESIYNGTFEFTAGQLDRQYENIYDSLKREIMEETGLKLKRIINDSQTKVFSPQQIDAAYGFRPFCCVQQLREGLPWVGFIFRCEVEDGAPVSQEGENENVRWVSVIEVKRIFMEEPEKLFTLEIPAWDYYFSEVVA